MSEGDTLVSARALDVLYQKTDKIYYEFARGCGLSETAYWILYAVEVSGGSVPQAVIAEEFSYSKQTVNSSLTDCSISASIRNALTQSLRTA